MDRTGFNRKNLHLLSIKNVVFFLIKMVGKLRATSCQKCVRSQETVYFIERKRQLWMLYGVRHRWIKHWNVKFIGPCIILIVEIKIDQLYVTCFIISLFTAQHVSNVSTSIFRCLRLTVRLFHVLYCSGSMCVGVKVWFGWVVWYPYACWSLLQPA